MNNLKFYEREIATVFWVHENTSIIIEDYSARLHAYYVRWLNVYDMQHRWLDIEDMKVIRHCIFAYFGRESHSFEEWQSLIKLVKKCQPHEVLERFSY